ncbi:helix-turn-helix domain-containing protein [Paenibacillus lautus]|uniref:helix-turn-helix domain-containing protein n=1 Tax=Paenibacillus lautus TaxID=1401 RepID=UPI003D2B25D2
MTPNLGVRIAELRKKKNMTQGDLAKVIGKSTSTIAMWEIGKRDPDSSMISKLADTFGVTADYLLGIKVETSIEETPSSIKAWLRADNDLLPEEKEQLSDELEDYFKVRKERLMKDRNKGG